MLFDDTVRELFLRNFWSSEIFYPSETVMASAKPNFHQFPKVTSSKMSHLILSKCCHVVHFPLSSFICTVHPKNLGNCLYVRSGYSDCHTNLLLVYVDILRKFGWYSHTIRWYFSSNLVNHMVDWYSRQKSAKILYFTLKRQIKVPATQNTCNTHITQKMDLATCTIFSMVPFIHGKC